MSEVPNSNPESKDEKPLLPADQFKKEKADRFAKSQSDKFRAEAEREEKGLRLAANEARKEAKKQRRGSSVSSAEDLADAKERKELKEYFRKTHKTGKFEYDEKDKDVDLSDKKGIKLKGTTDASWFDLDVKRPASWYQQLAEDAVKIKELRGHIKTNLTPDAQAKMDKLIDLVLYIKNTTGDNSRFDHDKWNDVLMAQASSKEDVLGSQGLYNYILAFRRAASKKEGKKTVRRELSEKDFSAGADGKVKFASIDLNLASDKKGSKFRETVISGYDDKKEESVETKKDVLDQFSAEMDKVLPEVEKATGVKITKDDRPAIEKGGIKAVEIYGQYGQAIKSIMHVELRKGKIVFPKKGGEYTDPKEAAAKAKDLLIKLANDKKKEVAESTEVKKDVLDQFSYEMDKVLPEVEQATGVKITKDDRPAIEKGGIKAVEIYGQYGQAIKSIMHVELKNGKIVFPKKGGEYKNPKEAAAKAKDLLIKLANDKKKEVAESAEVKKDVLDQFSDEMDKVLPEVEQATGVKITKDDRAAIEKGGIKAVEIYGQYGQAIKSIMHVELRKGKIVFPKKGGEYTDPKEAAAKAKDLLIKLANDNKPKPEPKVEPKKEEPKPLDWVLEPKPKPEPKKEEPKPQPKVEPKKEEPKPQPKVEPKKEEPKPQPKVEPKKEEPKPQPKVEPKKEEPKPQPKIEPKKEEPKPQPKVEPKKEETKPLDWVLEPKPKPEPKPEPKPQPKVEPKKEEPKAEPKVEPKKPEPKAVAKVDKSDDEESDDDVSIEKDYSAERAYYKKKGKPYMSQDEALEKGLITRNGNQNIIKDGYELVASEEERAEHQNWAVRKSKEAIKEDQDRAFYAKRKIPYMNSREAEKYLTVTKDGSAEPKPGYEWVVKDAKMLEKHPNFAVKEKAK